MASVGLRERQREVDLAGVSRRWDVPIGECPHAEYHRTALVELGTERLYVAEGVVFRLRPLRRLRFGHGLVRRRALTLSRSYRQGLVLPGRVQADPALLQGLACCRESRALCRHAVDLLAGPVEELFGPARGLGGASGEMVFQVGHR